MVDAEQIAPRLYRDLALIVLVVAAQQVLTIGLRDLWWADEVRHANVLQHLLDHGDWLLLHLNDKPYPDKPPVYFWFLAVIATLAGAVSPAVIFAGLAITVLFYGLTAYALGRTLFGDREIPIRAIAILVTGTYFLLLSHYARMDFLFSGFICLSWLFLYRGLRAERDFPDLLLGFLFAAIATLTKGPVGFLLPLLTVISFLVWRRRLPRLWAPDVAIGLLAAVILVGAWGLGIVAVTGMHYLVHIFDSQLAKRALGQERETLEFFRYCLTLPLVLLPWSLILLAIDWRSLVSRGFLQRLGERRGAPDDGPAFLWCCVLSGFFALSLIAEKHEYYLLPLLIPIALLIAAKVLSMSASELGRLWFLASAFLALFGLAVLLSKPILETALDLELPLSITGNGLVGAILLGGAIGLFLVRARGLSKPMIVLVVTQVLWINAMAYLVLPQAGAVMSPKSLASELQAYGERGYSIGTFKVLSGVLAYHLGATYFETKDSGKVARWLAGQEKAAVAMQESKWSQHREEFPDMKVVFRSNLVFRDMIIATKD